MCSLTAQLDITGRLPKESRARRHCAENEINKPVNTVDFHINWAFLSLGFIGRTTPLTELTRRDCDGLKAPGSFARHARRSGSSEGLRHRQVKEKNGEIGIHAAADPDYLTFTSEAQENPLGSHPRAGCEPGTYSSAAPLLAAPPSWTHS